ncbi:hypothetical protein MYIN104542_29515 [Mycobacterium intermedium]
MGEGPHRRWALGQHHFVSVAAEFVDRLHLLEPYIYRRDVRKVLRQSDKELRRQQQFLFGKDFPAHPLTYYAGEVVGTGAVGGHHSGGERLQQREVAHVAKDH